MGAACSHCPDRKPAAGGFQGRKTLPEPTRQRAIGNQANLHRLQAKLTISAVNDPLEQEADAAADRVMRMADPQVSCSAPPTLSRKCEHCEEEEGSVQRKVSGTAATAEAAPPILDSVLTSPGRALDAATQAFMGSRFGADFSDVRIHTDARAAQSAAAVNARAFTVDRDIVFGAGQYDPVGNDGRHLLAHELAHVVQQQRPTARPAIRRVLAAYSSSHSEILSNMSPYSTAVTSITSSADSSRIRAALAALIRAGKVEVTALGDRDFYSLPASGAATVYEVQAAFLSAGLPRALDLTAALMDRHNATLFTGQELTQMHGLWTQTIGTQTNVTRQTERPLTSEEVAEATLVFGPGLNYSAIRITEDPVWGAGQTARTLPSRINFPVGASSHPRYMPWLIHELTHSWQYQHGRTVVATGATAIACWAGAMTYTYGGKPALVSAAAAGRGLSSFNTEQQGDIARDYYNDLKSGVSVSEYAPFIAEFRTP